MSDSVPAPSSPKAPSSSPDVAPDTAPTTNSNVVAAAPAAAAAGPSTEPNNEAPVAPQPLSVVSSSGPSSSSHQPSPSPSGAKYENTKELKQLREKIESMGAKAIFGEQAELVRNSEATLTKHVHLMEEFMINLDPSHSSAAIIYALSVMFEVAASKKMENVMIRSAEILKSFVENKSLVREQVMHVIDIYTTLFTKVTRLLIRKDQSINGIPFLRAAIDLIVDEGDQTVTTLHGCLFTLCLKMHAIGPGMDYLYPYVKGILSEANPTSSPNTNNGGGNDSKPLLTYLYYGGLLAATATQWKRAASLLEAACFVPGYAVSEIQIESLKKLHIISFIAYGRLVMPTRSPNLIKAWKQNGTVYSQLASELELSNMEWDDEGGSRGWKQNEAPTTEEIAGRAKTVQKFITANTKLFEKDQNIDLLYILMHECKMRALVKVAELYKVASIDRITELANLDGEIETKQLLTALTINGRLLVSNEDNEYVRLELPVVSQSTKDINERQHRLMVVTEDLKRLDLANQKTPFYCQRTNKSGGAHDDEGLSMSNLPDRGEGGRWPDMNMPNAVPS
ncbi:hypothetical protein PFISCL1PPCAC_16006 [Pristionchus fissidentatus]|uniref:COP9 signalosome complex subunit 3 N-terminal helical repeats domain-containing protein n=1 Tax=Pristionchus fissidentatus TaxID=1538716 RepID=A0AAV5VYL0_9BILA|nr:hypothetical protein PFISCL1PPCAC_16006 [Pristionchus fissidentatus]